MCKGRGHAVTTLRLRGATTRYEHRVRVSPPHGNVGTRVRYPHTCKQGRWGPLSGRGPRQHPRTCAGVRSRVRWASGTPPPPSRRRKREKVQGPVFYPHRNLKPNDQGAPTDLCGREGSPKAAPSGARPSCPVPARQPRDPGPPRRERTGRWHSGRNLAGRGETGQGRFLPIPPVRPGPGPAHSASRSPAPPPRQVRATRLHTWGQDR